MVKRRLRPSGTAAMTDDERLWLHASPDRPRRPMDPVRAASLWAAHRADVLAGWHTSPPDRLPPGHPGTREVPVELRHPPDARIVLSGVPGALEIYRQQEASWNAERAAWFRQAGKG